MRDRRTGQTFQKLIGFMKVGKFIQFALIALCGVSAQAEEPWRFLVVADWHSAEEYVWKDESPVASEKLLKKQIVEIHAVNDRFGGDLILFPGDCCSGHWDGEKFIGRFMPGATPEQAILHAGYLCYSGMKEAFTKGGYSRLLMTVGDHEVGDNDWPAGSAVSRCQPQFKEAFAEAWTRSPDGLGFLYNSPLGCTPARPVGTPYEGTSYAFRYNNVLFVTVDVFHQESPDQIIGEEGTVTGIVAGKHLEWLDAVLSEARKDSSIKHIFVQAHLPVIHPVRKVQSSGMLMDDGVNCDFWKALRKYKVDIYFAGEVHANTVTKDPESDLLQVVTRGNYLDNLTTVDVRNDRIELDLYERTGRDAPPDSSYSQTGRLVVDKSGETTSICGEGDFALLDPSARLLYFPFEQEQQYDEHPINGRPSVKDRKVRGIDCWKTFPNKGEFGAQYDLLEANITSVDGIYGRAVGMDQTSRLLVWAMGPPLSGRAVSYALWIKTESAAHQVLVNTASLYHPDSGFLNLNLNGGIPEVMTGTGRTLTGTSVQLDDGQWHHLAVVMPEDDCLLSEVCLYVDGKQVATSLTGSDGKVYVNRAVRMSFGGMGHSHKDFDVLGVKEFCGTFDEISVWARALTSSEVAALYGSPGK